jgi:hypothetical protein
MCRNFRNVSIELSIIKVVSFEHSSTLPKLDLGSYRYNRVKRREMDSVNTALNL